LRQRVVSAQPGHLCLQVVAFRLDLFVRCCLGLQPVEAGQGAAVEDHGGDGRAAEGDDAGAGAGPAAKDGHGQPREEQDTAQLESHQAAPTQAVEPPAGDGIAFVNQGRSLARASARLGNRSVQFKTTKSSS